MERCSWLPPPSEGATFSGVIRTLRLVDPTMTKVMILGTEESALITKALPLSKVFTIYGYTCTCIAPVILCAQDDSQMIEDLPASSASCTRLVELCSGSGGMGSGAEKCDFQVVGFVDKNQLVVDCLTHMGKNNVNQADLTDDKQIGRLHASFDAPTHAFAAGFACQPFSFQGDLGGFSDPRSSSFWEVWCQDPPWQTLRLQHALQDFAKTMGFQIQDFPHSLAFGTAGGHCSTLRTGLPCSFNLGLRTWASRPSSAPGLFGRNWNWTTLLSLQRGWACIS